jgi:hypothetical protein
MILTPGELLMTLCPLLKPTPTTKTRGLTSFPVVVGDPKLPSLSNASMKRLVISVGLSQEFLVACSRIGMEHVDRR